MRFLLDQGLPRSAAGILRKEGVDAVHTGECGLATSPDADILDVAGREGRVVVTLDADFHALMAHGGATSPSVIRIRIEGLRAAPLVDILRRVLRRGQEELTRGSLVSVTPDQIRFHGLPVIQRSRGQAGRG